MSRICIGVLHNNDITPDRLRGELQTLLANTNLTISYKLSYNEPLLRHYVDKTCLIFSFSDNSHYDTCEMLLLPDNCFYNGIENMVPFHKRMQNVEAILTKILEHGSMIDLFIGDSGTQMNEFEENQLHVCEFHHISNSLNTILPPDLHLNLT